MKKIIKFFKGTVGLIILVVAAVATLYHFVPAVQDFIGQKIFKKVPADKTKPFDPKTNPWVV